MNARSDGQPKSIPRTYHYGVSWRHRLRPWIVKFARNKKTMYVGSFATLIEAELAARQYLKENK